MARPARDSRCVPSAARASRRSGGRSWLCRLRDEAARSEARAAGGSLLASRLPGAALRPAAAHREALRVGREGDDRPARRQQGIRATAGRRLPPPVRAEVPDPPHALRRPVRPRSRAARHERLLSLPSACCVALPGVETAEQLVDARVRPGRRPQSAREPLRRLRRLIPRRREAATSTARRCAREW